MRPLAIVTALASAASCLANTEQATKSATPLAVSHSTASTSSAASLTSSKSKAHTSSATASATPLPSPKVGAKFILRTSILPGQKNAARFDNLYVSQLVDQPRSWFELFGEDPQVFTTTASTTKSSNSSIQYRNVLYNGALSFGEHTFFWNNGQLLFDYAGWQFAGGTRYNSSIRSAGPALRNGTFYFDETTGLRWKNTLNKYQRFEHWFACPWWYDTIQLFWVSSTERAGIYTLPDFCAKVNLLPYTAPAAAS